MGFFDFLASFNPWNQAASMMRTVIIGIIVLVVIILLYRWSVSDSFTPGLSFVCEQPPCLAQPLVYQ